MARTHRSPDGVYANGGAVAQHDGKLAIYVCNDCGREVVWATSAKTGRKYLANISHGQNGFRFYIGANIHRCDRSRTPEGVEAAEVEREIKAADAYAIHAAFAAKDAAFEAGDKVAYAAAKEVLAALIADPLRVTPEDALATLNKVDG